MSLIVMEKLLPAINIQFSRWLFPAVELPAGATGPKTPIEPDGPEDQASISLKHKTKSCSIEKFRKYNWWRNRYHQTSKNCGHVMKSRNRNKDYLKQKQAFHVQ